MSSKDHCILCFKILLSASDRNYTRGKSCVEEELNDLSFVVVNTSEYICKSCLGVVRKRKTLKSKLVDIEQNLLLQYKNKAAENGISCKLKHPSKRANNTSVADTGRDNPASNESHDNPDDNRNNFENIPPLFSSTPKKRNPQSSGSDHSNYQENCSTSKDTIPETKVTVCIEWPSKKREKMISEELLSLGKMMCRGTLKQIATAAWKCKALRPHFLHEMAKDVNRECTKLCSKKSPSCLRMTDPENFSKFSLPKAHEELKDRAPLFHLLLRSASFCPRKNSDNMRWTNAIGVAASVCLNNRSQNMNTFQLTLCMILQHSGFMVMFH